LARVFCFFFAKKQAFLPLALTAAAYLGSYEKEAKNFCELGPAFPDWPTPKNQKSRSR
jgi:hypothetical protein